MNIHEKQLIKIVHIVILLSFASIFQLGCSSASTENYSKVCSTWMNLDINELIMSWGPPSDEYRLPDGKTIYTWLNVGGTRVTSRYNWFLDQITTNAITY